MHLSQRARRHVHFEQVLRLRGAYARRGPLDGRTGQTPDHSTSPAIRWHLKSVLEDACAAMRLGPADHARWRHGMGLDEEPQHAEPTVQTVAVVAQWSDKCPMRGPFLTHARMKSDPPGVCVHCHQTIR